MKLFIQNPDIKAKVTLNENKSGYRPSHLIIPDYLTTGVHVYADVEYLYPNHTAIGYITFISPEAYPHSLEVGQVIEIYEGSKVVGKVEVLEIYNIVLKE